MAERLTATDRRLVDAALAGRDVVGASIYAGVSYQAAARRLEAIAQACALAIGRGLIERELYSGKPDGLTGAEPVHPVIVAIAAARAEPEPVAQIVAAPVLQLPAPAAAPIDASEVVAEFTPEMVERGPEISNAELPAQEAPKEEPAPIAAKPSTIGPKQHEIEPGRSVVNNWDKALFEPYADRKARLQPPALPASCEPPAPPAARRGRTTPEPSSRSERERRSRTFEGFPAERQPPPPTRDVIPASERALIDAAMARGAVVKLAPGVAMGAVVPGLKLEQQHAPLQYDPDRRTYARGK